jgi:outer membrane protein TolC
MKTVAVPLLFSLFICAGALKAAEPLVLTLDESIAIAMDKDLGYRRAMNSEQSAEFGFLAAKAYYRPRITFEGISPNRTEETREQFDFQTQLYRWVRTGTSLYKSTISISQMLPTDGSVSFGSYLHNRNQYNTLIDVTKRSEEYQTWGQVLFWQPFFKQSFQRVEHDKSKLQWSKAKHGLRKGESDLVYNVTDAFLNLLKAEESLKISQEQEKLSRSAYEIAVAKRDAGVADEIDVLQTQSIMAENRGRTMDAETALRSAGFTFKKLLRIDPDQPITLLAPAEISVPSIDLEEALEKTRENNTEIRQAELDCELSKVDLWDAKRAGGLSADLYMYYNLTGTDSLFNQSYKDPNRNTRFLFQFNLPLYDSGQKKARVSRSKISLQNNEVALTEVTERIEQDVRLEITNLADSRARIEQAGINLQYNEKLHEQAMVRYKIGQVTTYQLVEVQINLARAQKTELDARIARRLALAKIEQLTQTSWR